MPVTWISGRRHGQKGTENGWRLDAKTTAAGYNRNWCLKTVLEKIKMHLRFVWQIDTSINELQYFILWYFYNVIGTLRMAPVPASWIVFAVAPCPCRITGSDRHGRDHWWDGNFTTKTTSWVLGWFNSDKFVIQLGSIQMKQVVYKSKQSIQWLSKSSTCIACG